MIQAIHPLNVPRFIEQIIHEVEKQVVKVMAFARARFDRIHYFVNLLTRLSMVLLTEIRGNQISKDVQLPASKQNVQLTSC